MTLLAFIGGFVLGAIIPPLVLIAFAARLLAQWGDDGWGRR